MGRGGPGGLRWTLANTAHDAEQDYGPKGSTPPQSHRVHLRSAASATAELLFHAKANPRGRGCCTPTTPICYETIQVIVSRHSLAKTSKALQASATMTLLYGAMSLYTYSYIAPLPRGAHWSLHII